MAKWRYGFILESCGDDLCHVAALLNRHWRDARKRLSGLV